MSVASRVAKLSHAALVELVVAACEESPAIKNRADSLVAQVAPLPAWCVEVLLSPDLLSACFSSLKLTDARVAATCRAWRTAWQRQLFVLRPVLPKVQRTIDELPSPFGLCVQADDTLAVACKGMAGTVQFVSTSGLLVQPPLLGPRSHEGLKFDWPGKLVQSDGALFVCDRYIIRKLGPDGTQRASYVRPDADEAGYAPDLAVHQPTGVLLAAVTRLFHDEYGVAFIVVQLDAATLEPRLDADGEPEEFAFEVLDRSRPKCVAVEGDHVLVTEMRWDAAEHLDFTANRLHVLTLDGTLVRTIEGCGFGVMAASADQGRVYLIEGGPEAIDYAAVEGTEHEWRGRRLIVIDIETGSVLQQVRIEEARRLTDVAVHDGRVFLSDAAKDCIFVLEIAQAAASA